MCFFLLKSHIAWNNNYERMVLHGVKMRETINKSQLIAILAEELMNFTAIVDTYNKT